MTAPNASAPPRDHALDLTRAFLTLLVIAHHAVLAYHRYAPPTGTFTGDNLVWGAFPVIDAARAPVIDTFTMWNDSFFMAMMFLLSGLFVPSSLARKGPSRFLGDRLLRLGLPFAIGAAVLAPLAYLPAYLQRAEATGQPGFCSAWLALDAWPAGPAWFLWVLLGFGALAATLSVLAPRLPTALSAFGSWCLAGPVRACVALAALATLTYLPSIWLVNPMTWFTWGPFTVQTSRIALYAGYFLFGYALGAGSGARLLGDWMTANGSLGRHWKWWQGAAGVGFASFVAMLIVWLTMRGQGRSSALVDLVTTVLFAVTGAVTTFGVLATFARWGQRTNAFTTSLARNAFGMYLVHYAIVTWLQFVLLDYPWPGWMKAALVTTLAIAASWITTILLRRIPGVARVI